jgi:hypothetical protein
MKTKCQISTLLGVVLLFIFVEGLSRATLPAETSGDKDVTIVGCRHAVTGTHVCKIFYNYPTYSWNWPTVYQETYAEGFEPRNQKEQFGGWYTRYNSDNCIPLHLTTTLSMTGTVSAQLSGSHSATIATGLTWPVTGTLTLGNTLNWQVNTGASATFTEQTTVDIPPMSHYRACMGIDWAYRQGSEYMRVTGNTSCWCVTHNALCTSNYCAFTDYYSVERSTITYPLGVFSASEIVGPGETDSDFQYLVAPWLAYVDAAADPAFTPGYHWYDDSEINAN